jgi:hypothetical protein
MTKLRAALTSAAVTEGWKVPLELSASKERLHEVGEDTGFGW